MRAYSSAGRAPALQAGVIGSSPIAHHYALFAKIGLLFLYILLWYNMLSIILVEIGGMDMNILSVPAYWG